MNALSKVRRYCERWNVDIKLEETAHDAVQLWTHAGPGVFCLHWPSRTIIEPSVATRRLAGDDDSRALLHELSHVLLNEDPSEADEVRSAMLALDFYGGRWLRIGGWVDWMDSLTIGGSGPTTEWWEVSHAERRALVQASLTEAVRLGLLTPDGRPTFQRRAP